MYLHIGFVTNKRFLRDRVFHTFQWLMLDLQMISIHFIMKQIVPIFLLLIAFADASAQGVIQLSNINSGGLVTLNGKPVGIAWRVSFALPDGTLLGSPGSVSGAGLFSSGPRIIDGITGKVDLSVAAWDSNDPFLKGVSDPFSVTLGNMDNPASLPTNFSGVHIAIPEPGTPSLAALGILASVFNFLYRSNTKVYHANRSSIPFLYP